MNGLARLDPREHRQEVKEDAAHHRGEEGNAERLGAVDLRRLVVEQLAHAPWLKPRASRPQSEKDDRRKHQPCGNLELIDGPIRAGMTAEEAALLDDQQDRQHRQHPCPAAT